MKYILSLIVFIVVPVIGCSQKKLSDRDRQLQDQQQANDLKKVELAPIAGEYTGELTGTNGYRQTIRLSLEVRDVPENDGKPDAILVPKLLGTLRFYFGEIDSTEFIDAPVKSSEYIKARDQLSLVLEHAQFKEMVITGTADGASINGSWNAASLGVSGAIRVQRRNP